MSTLTWNLPNIECKNVPSQRTLVIKILSCMPLFLQIRDLSRRSDKSMRGGSGSTLCRSPLKIPVTSPVKNISSS